MKKMMGTCGTLCGVFGEVVCVAAVFGKFWGDPTVLGHPAMNLFVVGIALMVLGCFKKLMVLTCEKKNA